jgi:hypothetical protein
MASTRCETECWLRGLFVVAGVQHHTCVLFLPTKGSAFRSQMNGGVDLESLILDFNVASRNIADVLRVRLRKLAPSPLGVIIFELGEDVLVGAFFYKVTIASACVFRLACGFISLIGKRVVFSPLVLKEALNVVLL